MSDYAHVLRFFDALYARNGHPHDEGEERRLEAILCACSETVPRTAKELARLVGRKPSARLRSELALLCKRGKIQRCPGRWGYLLVPMGHR